jgi:hypothetical protein
MRNRKITVSDGKKNISILVYLMTLICTFFLTSSPASADLAGFQNGNFSNGFTGWSGQLFSTGSVDPGADSHFVLTAQGAQLCNDDNDLMVILYQDFQVGPLNSGNNKLFLNFWLQWSPTVDEQVLNISVLLSEYDPLTNQIYNPLDILKDNLSLNFLMGANVSFDVTSMVNKSARLAFTLSDSDFITPDYLTVGNISFSEQSTNPVPISSGLLLTISGLAGLVVFRRKNECVSTGREQK